MSKILQTYVQRSGGRSPIGLFGLLIATTLAAGFLVSPGFLKIFGLLSAAVAANGLYAMWKNEAWLLTIDSAAITWASPRLPRSSGSIPFADIATVCIDQRHGSGHLEVGLKNGESRIVPLVRYDKRLRSFLEQHPAAVKIDYRAPQDSQLP